MDLKGKNVLVTGAAKRVGRVIALAFADRGANVVIHYRKSRREAESLAKEVRRQGVSCWTFAADLSRENETKRTIVFLKKNRIRIDVLINNASLFRRNPRSGLSWKEWDAFFAVHVKAPFLLSHKLFDGSLRRPGRIVNIIDKSWNSPDPDYLPYGVSKAGLLTLTQGLAKALFPKILVTAVCPGLVLPPSGMSSATQKRLARQVGMKHWKRPQDVAKAVLSLVESDQTGMVVDV